MGEGVNLFDLAARISVDTANSDKALTSTQQKVLDLTKHLQAADKAAQSSSVGIAKATKHIESSAHSMGGEMLAARNAVRILGTEIGEVLPGHLGHAVHQMAYLDSSASAVSEAFALLATPVGATVAAIAGLGLIGIGSTATLYEFAAGAAETGNKLLSMSQKTGLSVENLQALDEAAKVSGASLDRIVQSVGMFEKKLTDAEGADTKLSRGFKQLGIDTSDANKALGQVIEFLGKFPAGITRTGVAMDIFGRSGKDMAAITDVMKGSLKDYLDEMIKMGEIIGTDDVTAARAFITEQERLGRQWDVIKFKIESAATPIVENWLKDISAYLIKNQNDIIEWGRQFVSTLGTIASGFIEFIGGIKTGWDQLNAALEPIDAIIRVTVLDPLNYLQIGGKELFGGGYKPGFNDPGPGPLTRAYQKQKQEDEMNRLFLPEKIPANPFAGGGGSRKGGGGGKAQKDELQSLKTALVGLGAEYRKFNVELLGSANASALAAEKEKLLADVMRSLKTETKLSIGQIKDVDAALDKAIGSLPQKAQKAARALVDQSVAQFKSNEEMRIAGELNKKAGDLSTQWGREIDNTRAAADQYTIAIQDLEAAYRKYGITLDASTRGELNYLAALQRILALTRERIVFARERERMVEKNRPSWIDLGGGSTAGGEPGTTTRPRIATVERQVLEDRIQAFNERMRQLAGGLTNTIDNALRDGFDKGMRAGLISFAQGILEMIRSAALAALEKKLTEVFTNAMGGASGGGGRLARLLGFGLQIAGAAAGGSIAPGVAGKAFNNVIPGIHFAKGGIVPGFDRGYDSVAAVLEPGERVLTRQQQQQMTGGHTIHVTFVLPNNMNAQSFGSQPTQHQIAKKLHSTLAKAVLMG